METPKLFKPIWDLIDAAIRCEYCREIEHVCPDHFSELETMLGMEKTFVPAEV